MNQLLTTIHPAHTEASLPMSEAEKTQEMVHQLIIDNALNAMLTGLIPIPVIDSLLISGIQLKMLSELCLAYEERFTKHVGKAVLLSLLGGVLTAAVDHLTLIVPNFSWFKTTAQMAGVGLVGGAITYAVGRVFWRHLEEGGSLLDFDVQKSKEYLVEMYEEGKQVVKEAR